SYSLLFIKPVLSVYMDKQDKHPSKLKIYSILGAIGMIFFLFISLLYAHLLLLFGLLLGLFYAFMALIDVAIDKSIVSSGKNEKTASKNSLLLQLGGLVGSILTNLFFLIIIQDIQSLSSWNAFFLTSFLFTAPLILILFWFQPQAVLSKYNDDNLFSKNNNNYNNYNTNDNRFKSNTFTTEFTTRDFVLMCLFIFIINAEELYQYPLEPWAINRLGPENAWMISVFYIIFILINAIFIIIASKLTHRIPWKLALYISIFFYAFLTIVAPWTTILTFFILIAIQQIFTSFLMIYYVLLMIQISERKVLKFQIMASFGILGRLVFTPIGTALTTVMITEWIITIAGILQLISLLPLLFIGKTNTMQLIQNKK
ncbi:MAG: MFS transporter, partial [Candidatus Helarchaeota archaeon]